MSENEATAGLKINKLLEEAVWGFIDDKNSNANKELITLFEQKIKDKIASVWGE